MALPLALRSALVDAMGGWGPFTVREIAALFNDHGFAETADVEPEQGVRRTEAAEHLAPIDWDDADQRRRLLALIDDVLEFYPEAEEDSPLSPGRRLRRALERLEAGAGATAGQLGTVERTTNLDDPFDVWPPGRIRLFFSHASARSEFVGRIGDVLELWPFACFVAHQEIEPSLEWKEVIGSALGSCHALIAFVTDDFHESAWCNQEVGWAFGRGLVVVPVRVTSDPRGFAGSIQAIRGSLEDEPGVIAERIASALMTSVFRETRPGAASLIDPLTDAIVRKFCESPSSELALRRFDFLQRVPRPMFTAERRLELDTACEQNQAVREARLATGEGVPESVRALWG
jgi:hypothetical protein